MKKKQELSSKQKALLMAYGGINKKAIDPLVLDICELSSLADFFVIVSGKTEIQVRAITQEIERVCLEEKIKIYKIAGEGVWSWVLMDMGDVIVHIFKDRERHYYDLESLWQKAGRVSIPEL